MSVRYEKTGTTALITLDRPDKLNSLTLSMYEELGQGFDEARDDDSVAAVVLTGSGRAFCVGADLTESIPALAEGRFDISEWDSAHQKHSRLFKPVICAVNGLALGGGFEIMLSTDLRVASEDARFGLPEAGVGVVPAGGTLARLTRQISYAHAMELLLLSDQIDSATAYRMGLVNAVVEPGQVVETAVRWADRVAALSGDALAVTKRAVAQLSEMPLEAAFHAEALYGQQAFTSADAKVGLAAFANRSTPKFPSRG